MAKYKVLAVVNSEEMRLILRQEIANEESLVLLGFSALDNSLLTKINGYAPHIVLLVQEEGDTGMMDIAQRIYQGFPGCAVVLLSNKVDITLINNAMQVGIRQVVDSSDLSTLNDALLKAAVFERGRIGEAGREPHVISIYGGKGGAGKTTVAVNLAVALAQTGRRTALIDLCLTFGDVSVLLNISAKDTISELVQEKSSFTIDDIKSFSMQHSSGVSVLSAPSSPELAEYITPKHVEALVNIMRPYYDFIVLDLPSDLSESTLTAIENSDDIVLVSRLDIPNLRAAKAMFNIFNKLQQEEKVLLLLNADHKAILTHKDFERVLERPISFVLPNDEKSLQLSQERGTICYGHAPVSCFAGDAEISQPLG
ncbi:MAG: AAA family ATPase [Eubacteriales bacterium]